MIVDIPYGMRRIKADIPNCLGVLEPASYRPSKKEEEIIEEAVFNPIGTKRLKEIAVNGKNAVIVVNDLTRPDPAEIMVKSVLDELWQGGLKNQDITIVIATGNHRPMNEEEIKEKLGISTNNQIKCLNHDCMDPSNMKYFGRTKRGMPVYVNKIVGSADIKIVTGLIMPHQSAGFSGGRKSIVPGVSGIETLKIHHSFPIRPIEPIMGEIIDNPFHEEAMEGARMVGVDFMVNTIQNERHEVIYAVAGDLEEAYYKGVEYSRKIWEVEIARKADVVVTSPGGYPRDIDLHQAQKALASAELTVKSNGVIILVAECREGIGKFADILRNANTPLDVVEMFKREGYTKKATSKAFMFARAMLDHMIIIVNDVLTKDTLESMFFIPAGSVEEAINIALKEMGKDAEFLVLPSGSEIIPKVKGSVGDGENQC